MFTLPSSDVEVAVCAFHEQALAEGERSTRSRAGLLLLGEAMPPELLQVRMHQSIEPGQVRVDLALDLGRDGLLEETVVVSVDEENARVLLKMLRDAYPE